MALKSGTVLRNAVLAVVILGSTGGFALPAFPGAEGWGADTPGGRGGKVYVVTTLAGSGPGSLLAGILMKEPRIIVFRVSGVIELNVSANMLTAENSNFTIAGQTSPGGITITNGSGSSWVSYGVDLNNFVFRFLRFRTRGANDGIQFGPHHHFIIDHCDFSGGEDETTDFFYPYHYTVQWSTITNSEEANSKGTIVAGRGDHITFHHNLWAHHSERAPGIFWDTPPADHGLIDFRNNVVYNIKGYSSFFSGREWPDGGEGHANFVGNNWKEGPNMNEGIVFYGPYFDKTVKVFDEDNCFFLKSGAKVTCDTLQRRYGAANRVATPWATPTVTTSTSAMAYEDVLTRAGAIPRDSMNRRVEREVRTGTGVPLVVSDPLTTTGPAPQDDGDMDGMPDCWENRMGFDPDDASDTKGDHDGDGYTNIEEYINDVALSLTGGEAHNFALGSGCPAGIGTSGRPNPGARGLQVSPSPYARQGALTFRIQGIAPDNSGSVLEIRDVGGNLVLSRRIPAGVAVYSLQDAGPSLVHGVYFSQWKQKGRLLGSARFLAH